MVIPGFDRYDITEDGVVSEIASGRIIKQVHAYIYAYNGSCTEYPRVSLKDNDGRVRMQSVIRLLALAYLPKTNSSYVARAKDGNNFNTRADNVEWVSRSYVNKLSSDKIRNDPTKRRKSKCKTPESVNLIYDALLAYDRPVTMTELNCALQVPYSVVRYSMLELIRNGIAEKVKHGYALKLLREHDIGSTK